MSPLDSNDNRKTALLNALNKSPVTQDVTLDSTIISML